MTITIREQQVTSTSVGGAPHTVTLGAGTATTDTLLLIQGNDYYTLANLATPTGTAASTWTQQFSFDGGTNLAHFKVWTAPVTTAGAQTVVNNFTGTGDEEFFTWVLVLQNAVYDTAASGTGTGSPFAAPTVTPAAGQTDDLLVCVYVNNDGGAASWNVTGYPVAPFTPIAEQDAGTLTTWAGGYEQLTSSSATGTRSITTSTGSPYAAISILMKSAGGGGGGSAAGTVIHVATSTPAATGTTTTASTVSITPTLPTGTAAGDRVFVVQAGNNTNGGTPANWTSVTTDTQVGPTGTAPGAGVGRRYLSVFYRDYDGVWTMPSFTLTSATQNTNACSAITLRKGATDTWNSPTVSTAGNTSAAVTAYSVTTGSLTTGKGMVLVGTATNDNVTASAESLSQTGATFANLTERSDTGSATGNDVSIKTYTADVTTGATATITHAVTLSAASEGGSIVVSQTSTAHPLPASRPYVLARAVSRASLW